MTELSDWIWLVVAGIWVVTRVLPRLFRSRKGDEAAPKTSPAKKRAERTLPSKSFGEGYGTIGRRHPRSDQPRPIEPR